MKQKSIIVNIILGILLIAVIFYSYRVFSITWEDEYIYIRDNVKIKKLSEYYSGIKGTIVDTDVYIIEGKEKGGTIFLLGGTHSNEPAGQTSAIILIENIEVEKGRVIIIPRANLSGFTCGDSLEGFPQFLEFKTRDGSIRKIRVGGRFANQIHQWPDFEIYIHYPSGQKLQGPELRNLNRNYPGRPDGTLIEKLGYSIIQLIKKEKPDISIDLHESAPEYPVVQAIVAFEDALDIGALAVSALQEKNIIISLEPSAENFRGLSHREWGEFTDTLPFLFEVATPGHGRARGKTDADLFITGKDPFYIELSKRKSKFLVIPCDEEVYPLWERTGYHFEMLKAVIEAYNEIYDEEDRIIVSHIPSLEELKKNGIGYFLHPL